MERHEADRPKCDQGNQSFWKHPDLPFPLFPIVCLTAIINPNSAAMRNTND